MRLHEEIEAHRQARAQLRTSIHARERQIVELKSVLAEERRRVQDLRSQIQAVQDSMSWKLLTRLGRMKSRVLRSGN
jgi:predicted  nucleic acid-binding Zn-ribbon protein